MIAEAQQMRIQGVARCGLLSGEIAVDLFAGGGGASLGIEQATGISPAIAVNHDPHAVNMHAMNHPDTEHLCESVWDVDPVTACRGRPVGLLWGSPDCTHFSRAKGGKPRDGKIRGLAWALVTWATAVAPRIIAMENVPEFMGWGPLDDAGHPIPEREGETFREFLSQLRALGYRVEHRVLVAADYGAPTIRKRFFLVARRDGLPVRWPEQTHGEGRAQPWRPAAECIDWSLPCPSIFDRKRPLAPATCRRIAAGIVRYVLTAAKPFLVSGYGEQPGEAPRCMDLDRPLGTVTAGGKKAALVAPMLAKAHSHGWDKGGGPIMPADRPAWTVTAKDGTALVSAFLAKHYTGVVGSDLRAPMGTVTAVDHHSLVGATLIQTGYGGRAGQSPRVPHLDKPLGTIMATGQKHALVAGHLTQFYGSAEAGRGLDQPAPTITGQGQHSGLVAAFLTKYYERSNAQGLAEPLHTIVSKARFGLVTVPIEGEEYVLADIGLRMLAPRELARAQGFPDSYQIPGTQAQQVARIGNSVPPPVARAIVAANLAGVA